MTGRFSTRALGAQLTLVAMLTLGGCVLPIGPEFEDPEAKYPPYLAASSPPVGGHLIVSATSPSRTIEVRLGDPNLQDDLHVRWIYDYPPYDEAVTRLTLPFTLPPSAEGKPVREPIRLAPDCSEHQLASGLATHRLMLAVSDRPFLAPEDAPSASRYDTVESGAHALRAVWLVTLDCP